MSNYELMVIFTPVLSEDDFKSAQQKYEQLVKDNGGSIMPQQPLGTKITGVSHCQKDHRYLLGNGVQCANQLQ